jgi:hypothetical protein
LFFTFTSIETIVGILTVAEALGLEGSDVPFSFMVDGFLEDALIELDLAGSFLVDWFVFFMGCSSKGGCRP